MFRVPAVAVPRAEFFVDSFVSCVIGVADAVDAIVAAPSTLSTFVSFVVSQEEEEEEKNKTTSVDDNSKKVAVVDKVDVPEVIELLDDDEVSSDEEEDEVVYLGTVPAPTKVSATPLKKAVAVAVAVSAPKSPLKTTVSAVAPKKSKTATAAAALKSPPQKKTATEPAVPELLRKKKSVAATAAPAASEKRRLLKKKTKTVAVVVTAAKPAAPAAPEKRSRPKKTVSFGSVQVQEYSVILGDHPKCKGGYPMSLDWAHTEPKEYDLDACEQAKAAKAKAAAAKEEKADGAYTDKKKSRRPGKGRRLRTKDRHLRISKVSGIPPKEVRKLEVERQRKVHEAEHGVDLKRAAATAKASKGKSLGGYHEV
jgi:hypothetical protein